jgi:membrane protein
MTNFTSYQIIYGAFAAIPIFLLWVFLTWNIILLGVEISYAITAFHAGKNTKRHPIIMLLSLLELFYQRQQIGHGVTELEALDILGCDEAGTLPSFILMLEQQNLIRRTDDNKYVLIRNLSQINFWTFYQQLPYPLPTQTDIDNIILREEWMEKIIPHLLESNQYLAAKLSIPLSTIFERK